jgi:hypothetical protein
MTYRRVLLEVVVADDNVEILIQALGDALDKIEKQVTVFDSGINVMDTGEPEIVAEIATPVV